MEIVTGPSDHTGGRTVACADLGNRLYGVGVSLKARPDISRSSISVHTVGGGGGSSNIGVCAEAALAATSTGTVLVG
jgi:hypothetical protein